MKTKSLLLAAFLFGLQSQGADYASIRDGSWFVPTNTWSPPTLPTTGDNVSIFHSVSFNSSSSDQSVTIGNLNLTGAHLFLSGPANLMVGGSASVFSEDNYVGGLLVNQGTVFQNGSGLFVVDDYSSFRNLPGSVYAFVGDGSMMVHSQYFSTFENYGLLRKSAGNGVSTITNNLNNLGGTVQVDSGTLRLYGAGTSSNGIFTVAAGASLDLTGGNNPTWAGRVRGGGAGTVSLNGGTLNGSPDLTLDLPGRLFQWTGGTISGLTTNVNSITVAGSGSVYQAGTLDNSGLIRLTNTPIFVVNNYSYFRNLADGISDFAGDGGMLIHSEYYSDFDNYGLLRKSAGNGVSAITGSLNNLGGALEVNMGTLQIPTYVQGGGALTIRLGGPDPGQAGLLAVNGTASLNGPLTVTLANAFTPSFGISPAGNCTRQAVNVGRSANPKQLFEECARREGTCRDVVR